MFSMLKLSRILLFLLAAILTSANAKQTEVNYTVIPLLFHTSWYPSVIVTIEGKKIPIQFDLGAAKVEIALSEKILKQFHQAIIYTGKMNNGKDARGVITTVREFILPQVELGGLVINNIKGVESAIDKNPSYGGGAPPPEDAKNGLIGLGFVGKYSIIIDYKHAKLILINGHGYPPGYAVGSWQKIHFMLDGNVITDAKANGKEIKLLWDTGARFNMIKTTVKIPGETTRCLETVITELGLDRNICKGTIINMMIDSHYFGKEIFYTRPMQGVPVDGIIGEPFFKTHMVYINFAERIIAIKSY